MPIQFRKSIKLGPIRATLSLGGLSLSLGKGPLNVNASTTRGPSASVSGGGFTFRKTIKGGRK